MIGGKKTKALILAEQFQKELLKSGMPKDSPVMSARDLAQHCGSSVVTADRVLKILVENDFLYRIPRRGTFIRHDPPRQFRIAYAGPLPQPDHGDPIKDHAVTLLLEHFAKLGVEPVLIPYYTLRRPAQAKKILDMTDGLLLDVSFIDECSFKMLWDYKGKIVALGNQYIENKLPCSQVIPDYTEALKQFDQYACFTHYEKIIIVKAMHHNSTGSAESVCRILRGSGVPEHKIEQVSIGNSPESGGTAAAYFGAFRHFRSIKNQLKDHLVICMSEHFAGALRELFLEETQSAPDILSFDNTEAYTLSRKKKGFFTSVDRQAAKRNIKALDLLCRQLKDDSEGNEIHFVPAKLVIRSSVKKYGVSGEEVG